VVVYTFFIFSFFCLTLLMPWFSTDRARHHFGTIDIYQLMWLNLEQQCVVRFR
jgi:hypothetical protein